MGSRMLVGRGRSAMLGVWLGLVLVIGVVVAGCGGSREDGEAPENGPASPEEAGEVVVRVSGAEGTAYSGTYGSIEGDLQTVDDTIGAEPTEYQVEVEEGVADGVTAGSRNNRYRRAERGDWLTMRYRRSRPSRSRCGHATGSVPRGSDTTKSSDDEETFFEDADQLRKERS